MLLFMNVGIIFRFSIERQNVYQHISFKCSNFIPPENIRKFKGFLMFLGDIQKEHWELLYEPCSVPGLSLMFFNW